MLKHPVIKNNHIKQRYIMNKKRFLLLGTPSDKIFVTSGNEVRGYTSKGKLFLSFDSNMTESITSM